MEDSKYTFTEWKIKGCTAVNIPKTSFVILNKFYNKINNGPWSPKFICADRTSKKCFEEEGRSVIQFVYGSEAKQNA